MSCTKLDHEYKQEKSLVLERTPKYILLGAGPNNCSRRVLRALATQTVPPIGPEILKIIKSIKTKLKYVFQTNNRLTLLTQCSGNGGNETIIMNLLDPGDRLVVAIGGAWGEKVLDMALRSKINTLALRKNGEIFSLKELEAAIIKHRAKVLFVTHGESSGGTLQNLEGLGTMCHKHNCLLAVDAIVSTAIEPLFVDRWEIDAICAASQKGIGAPPGMSLLSFSPKAEDVIMAKTTPVPYYFDLKKLGTYWNCFGTNNPQYHYTYSSNLLLAIDEALTQICEEGLLHCWHRHKTNACLFWSKLNEIGLECFVKNEEYRFHGVTTVIVPPGIPELAFLNHLKEKYSIVLSPGYGPTLNKAFRIGLMGLNSSREIVEYLTKALEETMVHFKNCA